MLYLIKKMVMVVSVFTSAGSIDGVTNVGVTTIQNSIGGSEPETIESIKLNAPLDYGHHRIERLPLKIIKHL